MRAADPPELLKLANGRRALMPAPIAAVGGALSRHWPGAGGVAADERRRLVAGSFQIGWSIGQALMESPSDSSVANLQAAIDHRGLLASLRQCPPAILAKDAGPAASALRDRLAAAAGTAHGLSLDPGAASKISEQAFTIGLGLAVVTEGARNEEARS